MATASPGSFGDELRNAKARLERCPATRRNLKKTLARAAEAHLAEPDRPEVPKWGVGGLVTVVGVGVLLMLIVACSGCVPAESLEHVRDQHAVMVGHALDERGELPLEARQIAADAARGFSKQHRLLAGDELATPPFPADLAPITTLTDGGR